MPCESTMICIDDSDWMRNGDFIPTRLQAQQDAVNVICRAKNRESPENNFGVSTLTEGKVLTTLTSEMGKVLAKMHMVEPHGHLNLVTGLRVAHIALKHRSSKSHKMRIVAFIGSPVTDSDADLTKLGKRLKKENVCVDIVNFGELELNSEKLEKFIEVINGKGGSNCHLINVEPSSSVLLSDALMTSPIIGSSGDYAPAGFPAAGGSGGGGGFDFGVDPTQDPDLALALRVSMEEERQRQEAEARRAMEQSTKETGPATGGAGESAVAAGPPVVEADGAAPLADAEDLDAEEAMLAQALQMSLQQTVEGDTVQDPAEEMQDEDELALAMQMSLQQEVPMSAVAGGDDDASAQLAAALQAEELENMEEGSEDDDDIENQLGDPDVLRSVLSSLPGVNPDSEAIQAVIESAVQQRKADKKDDDEEDPMDQS